MNALTFALCGLNGWRMPFNNYWFHSRRSGGRREISWLHWPQLEQSDVWVVLGTTSGEGSAGEGEGQGLSSEDLLICPRLPHLRLDPEGTSFGKGSYSSSISAQ